MRSKTRGWQLDKDEIIRARQAAASFSTKETKQPTCPLAKIDQREKEHPTAL